MQTKYRLLKAKNLLICLHFIILGVIITPKYISAIDSLVYTLTVSNSALAYGDTTMFSFVSTNTTSLAVTGNVYFYASYYLQTIPNPSLYTPPADAITITNLLWSSRTIPGNGSLTFSGPLTANIYHSTPIITGIYGYLLNNSPFPYQLILVVPDSSYYSAVTTANNTLTFDASFAFPTTICPISILSTTNGSAVISGKNVLFTPDQGFSGTASFTYSLNYPNLVDVYQPAIITITVQVLLPTSNNDFLNSYIEKYLVRHNT